MDGIAADFSASLTILIYTLKKTKKELKGTFLEKCPTCDKTYTSKADMKEHMQNEHGRFCAKDRSYPCSNCHKTFKKNAQLRRHKRRYCCQED